MRLQEGAVRGRQRLRRIGAADDVPLRAKRAFNGATADSSYVGDYAILYRPIELVGLSAELDTAFRLTSPDRDADAAAFAAGLGVQFHVERLRIGLSLGFGIGEAGRGRFGDVNGQLTLDFGLGTP